MTALWLYGKPAVTPWLSNTALHNKHTLPSSHVLTLIMPTIMPTLEPEFAISQDAWKGFQ
jgi:hypothetical protein